MRRGLIPAFLDIFSTLKEYSLVGMLGWQDVRHRYKRSALGAFWLTISTGVMISAMGLIFGKIFHSPLHEFFPYLTLGMIFWTLISSCFIEGAQCFIIAQPIIKQLNIPLFVHVCRIIWKNILIFAHNLVLFPIVFIISWQPISYISLLAIPGLILLIINLAWIMLLLSTLCARYRDMPPIINSILQIFFYLTPVMWMPDKLSNRASTYLVDPNPFYHLLSIVRAPLLNQYPSLLNWLVSIGIALFGWSLTIIIYSLYRHRIAYWL